MSLLILAFIILVITAFSSNRAITHVVIIAVSIIFSTRNELVPDTTPYMMMYDGRFLSSVETGYLTFCDFCRTSLSLNFSQFLFLLSFMSLEIWYFCTKSLLKNVNKLGVLLVLMMSYMGFYFYGIVLRSSIAITLCYVGITLLINKRTWLRYVLYYLIVLLSIQIHQGAILFVFTPICFIRYKSSILYTFVIISTVLLLATTLEKLEFNRFMYYTTQEVNLDKVGVGLLTWISVAIAYVVIYLREKLVYQDERERYIYNFFCNLYVFATLINSAVWQLTAVTRLPMQWLFFEYVLFYFILYRNKNLLIRRNKVVIAITVSTFYFFSLVHSFPLLLNY
jgi:hypothetical protein